MFDLPSRASTLHAFVHMALADPQVGDPTAGLDLVLGSLPILDAIAPHVRSRGIEGHSVDKAKPMHHARGAVVPLLLGDRPRVVSGRHLVAYLGMIPCLNPKDRGTRGVMQRLDVGGVRTATVCGDEARERRVIVAQLGHEALGGMTRTVISLRAIVFDHGLGQQRNDCTAVGMEHRRPQQWVRIGERPMAMDLLPTRVTVNRLRGQIPRAIEGQERRAVKNDHLCQGLAALELPEDGPKHGAERLRRHRLEALAHSRVTREDRKSTRLNSSHIQKSRMPSSA